MTDKEVEQRFLSIEKMIDDIKGNHYEALTQLNELITSDNRNLSASDRNRLIYAYNTLNEIDVHQYDTPQNALGSTDKARKIDGFTLFADDDFKINLDYTIKVQHKLYSTYVDSKKHGKGEVQNESSNFTLEDVPSDRQSEVFRMMLKH